MLIFDNFDIPEAQKLTKWFQKLSEKRNFISISSEFYVIQTNCDETLNFTKIEKINTHKIGDSFYTYCEVNSFNMKYYLGCPNFECRNAKTTENGEKDHICNKCNKVVQPKRCHKLEVIQVTFE